MDCNGFCFATTIAATFGPPLVFHSKSVHVELGNTVHMSEGLGKICPFLAAVRPYRTAEQGAYSGIRLLHQGNQIVRAGGAVLAGQLELTVEGFELVTSCIHGTILPQFFPVGISGNFPGVSLVSLDAVQRIVAIVPDKRRIDRRDPRAAFVQHIGDRLIIIAGVLHYYPDFTVQGTQLLDRKSVV